MRIAVMGAGSLGTIIGALITRRGGEIDLIDANREHVDALNKNGATITGKLELNVPVRAMTPEEMTGIYDIVFYLVKQTYNQIALSQLLPHLGPNSTVCTLQNGVPEDAVAEVVGRERTIGCAVGWGATWVGPGVSRLTSDADSMSFDLGEMDGSVRKRTSKIAALLGVVAQTEVVPNLAGIRWSKLLTNATLSGMSAVLGCTFGTILDCDKALTCAVHIGNETIRVAGALGIALESLQGHDLRVLGFNNKTERAAKLPLYRKIFGAHRLLTASMLQDLEKGRRTEIDAINGVVSLRGQRLGIPTPVNDKVVEIVKGIENGKWTYGFQNIDLFRVPETEEG